MNTVVLLLATALSFSNGTVGTYEAPVATNRVGVVDFGRDAFGWLEVRSPGGRAEICLGEALTPEGAVRINRKSSVRGVQVTCNVSTNWTRVPLVADKRNTTGCNGLACAVQLPSEVGVLMPFRYASSTAPLEFRRVRVHWPMKRAVRFRDDNAALKEVLELCQDTVENTSFAGLMVDGDRERIPYEGDIYINMLGELYGMDGDPELARRSIRHVLRYPTWPTEWKALAIMCVWTDWDFTGDLALARESYDLLKTRKLLREDETGLVPSSKDDLVDWPACERDGYDMETPYNGVVNAFHYWTLLMMRDLAKALGKGDEDLAFMRRAETVRKAFNATFFDPGTGLYVDGRGSGHSSLHVNAVALAFGLVDEGRVPRVVDFIARKGMVCSPYFAQYYLEALCLNGRRDRALELMTARGDRSWLGMKDQGATMTMEAWSGKVKPNQDWNHAWSTAPLNIIARFFNGTTWAHEVGCYYYWVNERVDPEGVRKDLQWMKSVGITKAFLATDIRNRFRVEDPWAGQTFGPNEFMSEHWWKCLETALETAGELGIEMGIFNGPGWSQSGGPWVKPEESMRYWDVTNNAPAICMDSNTLTPLHNSPCSPRATGLEVDKLSRKAVRHHFDAFIGEILRRIPAEKRKTLTTVVIDSWERGNKQNYTDDIFEKFKARFGYPLDYADPKCEKDLKTLISDLVATEYMGELTRCAHEHGLKTWCEPYAHGSPFPGNAIDYGAQADMVAAEFWVHDRKFRGKEMANALGAAKKKGTNRVYAESFTDGNWKTFAKDDWTFEKLKTIADKYHAAGVTDFILHVVISQPGDEDAPAVRPWFGSFFDRRSKHAGEVKKLVDYLKTLE